MSAGPLITQLLKNYLAVAPEVSSSWVFDREGLVIAKYARGEQETDPDTTTQGGDMVFGALASIIEPMLGKITEYEVGSFGMGTFEAEDYSLVFLEAGKEALFLTVVPYEVPVNRILPYGYLVAEKVAAILAGAFHDHQSLEIPELEFNFDLDVSKCPTLGESRKMIFKLIILGDQAVGKTSLINHFVTKKFQEDYRPTLGLSITEQEFTIQGLEESRLKFMIYDLAGQKFFGRVRKHYYFGAQAAFVVFDVTRPDTFERLQYWVDDVHEFIPEIPVVVVGNKIDLGEQREVSAKEGRAKARELRANYIETSALTGENVKDAFNLLGIGLFFKHA